MSADFIPPSESEKIKVAKNQKLLSESSIVYKFSEVAVLRFIRGHKGNEDKAYHFMEKHAQWRITEDVENISDESIANVVKAKKAIGFGRDKKGRPIVSIIARRHDGYNRDLGEIRKFIIHLLESTMKVVDPTKEQLTIVFDLHQFGTQCMDYESVKLLIEILQFNYPDVLGQAFIVNAPFIFWACWYAIKAWLDPVTASKVIFCDYTQLREYIDEESILKDLGADDTVLLA